jgi:hypothetical protein
MSGFRVRDRLSPFAPRNDNVAADPARKKTPKMLAPAWGWGTILEVGEQAWRSLHVFGGGLDVAIARRHSQG